MNDVETAALSCPMAQVYRSAATSPAPEVEDSKVRSHENLEDIRGKLQPGGSDDMGERLPEEGFAKLCRQEGNRS